MKAQANLYAPNEMELMKAIPIDSRQQFNKFLAINITKMLDLYTLGFIIKSLRISCQLFLYYTTKRNTGDIFQTNQKADK